MRKIFKGRTVLIIKRGDPKNYNTCGSLEKILFHFCGIWVSLWTYGEGCEFSEWAKGRFVSMFGPLVKFNRNTITTPKHEFLLQFKYWLLDTRYSWRETDNEQVLFDVNSQRYLGFFHSDAMFFGLGDTFFDNDIIDTVNLCTNPKYRKEFIKKLREADKANDSDYFYRVIKKGITSVVPLRERGNRKITNMEEAYQAACNFAKYVRWW